MSHPIPRHDMAKALEEKGFVRTQQDRDHDYYYFMQDGKPTRAKTKISRGSGYREYDDGLFKLMCRSLGLRYTREVRDLLSCPMGVDEYIAHLKANGVLPE